MKENEIQKKLVARLLKNQKFAVLTSNRIDQPYPSLICFIEDPFLKKILFFTSKETQKYKNLINNPKASIIFDNRTDINGIIQDGIAITAFGKVKPISNENENRFNEIKTHFKNKYPDLEKFLNSSNTIPMFFEIEFFSIVSEFENTENLQI